MERSTFWELIERSRKGAKSDPWEQTEILRSLLEKLPAEEIVGFKRIMNQLMAESYRADLWGVAFLINGGCSDDGFDYFRGWLIAQGSDVFEAALGQPDSLADFAADGDSELEGILYVASQAYEAKTKDADFYSAVGAPPDIGLIGDLSAWATEDGDIDESKARRLFPRVYAKYWTREGR